MSVWRQFRQLYPGAVAVVVTLLLVDGLLSTLLLLTDFAVLVRPSDPETAEIVRQVVVMRTWVYAIAAALLSWSRAYHTYPASDCGYLVWLRMTPWTAERPLPLGPFLPNWPDAVVLLALSGLALSAPLVHAAIVPLAFIGTYFLYGAAQLLRAHCWRDVLVCAGVLAVALLLRDLWLILLVAAIGVLWVARALRACLSQFHERGLFWGEMHNHRELIFQGVDAAPLLRIDASTTSVPWLLVDRDRIEPSVSYDAGLLTSAILGSCAWLGARYFGDSDNTAYASIIIVFLILMTALLRWAVYHGFPPISLRGRLRTGHWIIPAHDRAVLVPIGIVLCGLAAWSVLTLCPISGALAHSLTFTLVVAIAFCAGPTHGVHRLTGA